MKSHLFLPLVLFYGLGSSQDPEDQCERGAGFLAAGGFTDISTPNANTTCIFAAIVSLESRFKAIITVEQNYKEPCRDFPMAKLALPPQFPLGRAKISWMNDGDLRDNCQIFTVTQELPAYPTPITPYSVTEKCEPHAATTTKLLQTQSPGQTPTGTNTRESVSPASSASSASMAVVTASTSSAVDGRKDTYTKSSSDDSSGSESGTVNSSTGLLTNDHPATTGSAVTVSRASHSLGLSEGNNPPATPVTTGSPQHTEATPGGAVGHSHHPDGPCTCHPSR